MSDFRFRSTFNEGSVFQWLFLCVCPSFPVTNYSYSIPMVIPTRLPQLPNYNPFLWLFPTACPSLPVAIYSYGCSYEDAPASRLSFIRIVIPMR